MAWFKICFFLTFGWVVCFGASSERCAFRTSSNVVLRLSECSATLQYSGQPACVSRFMRCQCGLFRTRLRMCLWLLVLFRVTFCRRSRISIWPQALFFKNVSHFGRQERPEKGGDHCRADFWSVLNENYMKNLMGFLAWFKICFF